MNIIVQKANTEERLKEAFEIRREVFVREQQVSPEDEYDTFEDEAVHFLAMLEGKAAGTARWRFTQKGIKLERFAVLKSARGKGVGQALVPAVLRDIQEHPDAKGKLIYMHAQLSAIPLYEKFGFLKVGDIFTECDIQHYQMERYL